MMLSFIAAVYNEEEEIGELLQHIQSVVDVIRIVDDGSTDATPIILGNADFMFKERHVNSIGPTKTWDFKAVTIEHTGLPETVKNEALKMVPDGSWVLMLDADERFADGVLEAIDSFLNSSESEKVDYVYFRQVEVID